jgi:predicted RNA binding protein YcfA (HicA-like mRNA interferase family)
MKRIDLIRHLERHGVQFLREGGSHSVFVNRAAGKTSTFPPTQTGRTGGCVVELILCGTDFSAVEDLALRVHHPAVTSQTVSIRQCQDVGNRSVFTGGLGFGIENQPYRNEKCDLSFVLGGIILTLL